MKRNVTSFILSRGETNSQELRKRDIALKKKKMRLKNQNGMNYENSVETHPSPYGKQRASRALLCDAGSSAQHP